MARELTKIADVLGRYRVATGDGFDLDRFATDDLPEGLPRKHEAGRLLKRGVARLGALQDRLYASGKWSLLLVFQAMDAAGKDSTIKHVMSGINPQGVSVTSFKAPSTQELAHDFLWRVGRALPARGMIGIFNRSHYEDVLVTRVHEDLLKAANLPPSLIGGDKFWRHRIEDIAAYETYLGRQGMRIVKFFLNVSREEQKKRFLSRLDEPDKTWKFNEGDLKERTLWPQYRKAYQDAIAGTATVNAPWFVVPADRKWFARLVVAEAIIEALSGLDLDPPHVSEDEHAEISEARRRLEAD